MTSSAINSAEILAVGTELLLGEVTDTNSTLLAADLAASGVNVYWSLRVGDNPGRLRTAIAAALERSDLLVISGGLGPTPDDLTREAIAAELGETPAVDAGLEQTLRERFARLDREMPESNLKQAWLIPSAVPLANALGTAPGWLVTTRRAGRTRFIVTLPGPPREMTRMWRSEALPRLVLPSSRLYQRTFKTFGLGESHAAELLGELTASANPSVATYAKRDGVHVRVAAKAADAAAARELAAAAERTVAEALAPWTWGHDADELPQVLMAELAARGLKLATAEGPSGGALADALSAVDGAESIYCGGMLTWSAQAMGLLGMPRPAEDLQLGAQVAARLAAAARETFSADIGVATFGLANPGGRPEGTADVVFIAIQAGSTPVVKRIVLPPLVTEWRRERILYATLHLIWSQFR
jgi:nicotinamide-nucleotide amidase